MSPCSPDHPVCVDVTADWCCTTGIPQRKTYVRCCCCLSLACPIYFVSRDIVLCDYSIISTGTLYVCALFRNVAWLLWSSCSSSVASPLVSLPNSRCRLLPLAFRWFCILVPCLADLKTHIIMSCTSCIRIYKVVTVLAR